MGADDIREIRTFLRRTSGGGYRMEAEDGSLLVESRTYREVRADLEALFASKRLPPHRVKVLLGSARRPPESAPLPRPVEAQQTSAS
jgi:hypothetical protein